MSEPLLEKRGIGRPRRDDAPQIRGRHFFLTVPHFAGTIDQVLQALRAHQQQWQFLRWAVVKQTHTRDEDKGTHLHLYLGYPKLMRMRLNRFDYLGKHGKLERVRDYKSILKYMSKQSRIRANFDYMESILQKDFVYGANLLLAQGWKPRQIIHSFSSIAHRRNWQGFLRLCALNKQTQKFQAQAAKPGLRFITPELIRARLTPEQCALYYSSPVFARIVDKINDIVRYGCHRPHKAKALLITGAPNTGKTTLGLALQQRVGTFTFPDDGWWQGYQSDVFKLIMWNQFNLKKLQYPTLLKFLEGLRMDLPIKGSHITRCDNPLIYLTTNLSLEQHICSRFSSEKNHSLSRANLAARIEEVDIGSTPIFFLLKLLVSPLEDVSSTTTPEVTDKYF